MNGTGRRSAARTSNCLRADLRRRCAALCVVLTFAGCAPADFPPALRYLTIDAAADPAPRIVEVDTRSGSTRALFAAPPFSDVRQAVLKSDGHTLVFSYTPPPAGGSGFYDRSAIFTLDTRRPGAGPEHWFGELETGVFLVEPALTPDDRYLYYVRVERSAHDGGFGERFALKRFDAVERSRRTLVPNAIWPRVSPDGNAVTFIGVNPLTLERGLYVSAADGSALRELIPRGRFFDIDAPVFSADSRTIYFTVAEPDRRQASRFSLISAAAAHADHNVPSSWWRIDASGGVPEPLGTPLALIRHGSLSPQGDAVLYSAAEGVFVLDLLTAAVQRIGLPTDFGTVQWLP